MTGWTVFFLIAGVGAVTAQIMRVIEWLDESWRKRV